MYLFYFSHLKLLAYFHLFFKPSEFCMISLPCELFFNFFLKFFYDGFLLHYRHLGDNAELKILKKVGHAVNMEKPKEMYKPMKAFLTDQLPQSKNGNHSNDRKLD